MEKSLPNRRIITKSDPMGVAVYDYFLSGIDHPIKAKINGVPDHDMFPSLFFRNYQQMKGYERIALKLCKGSVLDVGACVGSHSLILQKRKLDVTALEKSSLAAQIAGERGVKRVVCDDIFNLKAIEYNTILVLMNGLGIAGDEAKTLKLLKHLKRLLAPKGFILGDSTDVLYRTMNADKAFEIGDEYHGNVEFELTYKGIKADKFKWIYLDPALLSELCDKAGLKCELIHRDENFHYLAKLSKA
jgi:SAM-dependent methyltransferase